MSHATTIKHLLKRGALVAAANWEVVLLQFVAETAFKLLLVVPVIGAAFLVALLVGGSALDLATADAQEILAALLTAFSDHPAAVLVYAAGLLVVLVGGSLLTFLVKGGTVATLVAGDRQARAIEQLPVRLGTVMRASVFRLDEFMSASGRLFQRYVKLGALLGLAYVVIGAFYLTLVFWSYRAVAAVGATAAWTTTAAVISGTVVLIITAVNLLYLLLQIAVAVDNCSVQDAVKRVSAFLRAEAVTVGMLFVTLLVIVGFATAGSILGMAGLGVIGFVPVLGLAVFPVQLAAWVFQYLVFQYLGLSALTAYLHLYRLHRAGEQHHEAVAIPVVSQPA
jgi:hypothetical protein